MTKTHTPDPVHKTRVLVSDILSRPMPDAAEGAARAGEGFEPLAAAYAKAGDNLVKARLAFLDINPDDAELACMIRAARVMASLG